MIFSYYIYRSPSPGYFNDDETLDFIVHWSVGAWPQYTLTQVLKGIIT